MKNDIFAVYKPVGMTSHDVVNQVRMATKVKRVGHGGTLDPLAEGVLVIAVGRENTKKLDIYANGDKEYVATLKLGYESETDDREGPIHKYKLSTAKSSDSSNVIIPTSREVKDCIKKFIGKIEQTPPIYSAIKVHGKEAYKYARQAWQGQPLPTMKSRIVEIGKIEILKYEYPNLEIRVTCGTGTYIRSLARDIGIELKTGAYLSELIRTKVGEFTLKNAIKIEDLPKP